MNSESYTSLKSDHDQYRGYFTSEQNAELDAMRSNGANWDKLKYAALAVVLGTIGLLLIIG